MVYKSDKAVNRLIIEYYVFQILGEIFKKGQCIQYPAGWEIAGIVHQVGSQVATVKKNDKIVGKASAIIIKLLLQPN